MKLTYSINNIYYVDEVVQGNPNKNLNKTIFQKCSEKTIDLPCFCYHENNIKENINKYYFFNNSRYEQSLFEPEVEAFIKAELKE